MRVRKAEIEDVAAVCRVLAEAFPALYRSIFGRMPQPEIEELLCSLYEHGHLTLENTRVCEAEDGVIGVAVLHLGARIGSGSPAAFWRLLAHRYNLLRRVRMFCGGIVANLLLDQRIPRSPDLVYIEALAVHSARRGQGAGSKLLCDSVEWTHAQGRSRMALHVLASNLAARRLYERCGFLPQFHKTDGPLQSAVRPGDWSSFLMVRDVSASRDEEPE